MAPPAASFDCRGAPSSCWRERVLSFCFSSFICLISLFGVWIGVQSPIWHGIALDDALVDRASAAARFHRVTGGVGAVESTTGLVSCSESALRHPLRYLCRHRSGGMYPSVLDQELAFDLKQGLPFVIVIPFVPAGWTGRTAYPTDDRSRSHDGRSVGALPARHRRRSAESESRTVARGARPAARRRIAESPESTQGRFRARGPRRLGEALHPARSVLRPRRPSGVREAAARPTGTRGHPRGLRCLVDRVTPWIGPLSTGTCAYAHLSHASCDWSASNRVVKRRGVCEPLHGRGRPVNYHLALPGSWTQGAL